MKPNARLLRAPVRVAIWVLLAFAQFGIAAAASTLANSIPAARRAEFEAKVIQKLEFGVAAPVYRFYNNRTGAHFYTASEGEREFVRTTQPDFTFEGVAFYAYPAGQTNAQPVYRFYNRNTGTHFYTMSEEERAQVAATLPQFAQEGVAWHAFPKQQGETSPVYRFFNRANGVHFYTINAAERDQLVARGGDFILEGAAYYAPASRPASLPANQLPKIALSAAGPGNLQAPALITLTAEASDADGTIIKVEFFDGGRRLAELVRAPYVFNWNGVTSGAYTLTARATDNLGAVATSAPLVLTVVPPAPALSPASIDAARFLTQATFGLRDVAEIETLKAMGYPAWLDREFAQPMTWHLEYLRAVETGGGKVEEQHANEAIWQQMFSAVDQLRTRIAFALSEVIVISNVAPDQNTWALASWMDMLKRNAFGNYRTLLEEATLHPAMGYYLNMVGNAKEDPARGRVPNENYAREVLQLFSIGLVQLNPDGSTRTGADGKAIATYDQSIVEGFARVFTGWSFGGNNVNDPNAFYDARDNWLDPLVAWPSQHSTSAKKLLNGVVLPPGQTAQKDLQDALDNIFAHPNVGPFIGRRLIQFLVTSNPSPAYIARVGAAFNNNGNGVRGDMKAVIRAILLDPEARDPALAATARFGKLREPVLRFTALMRGLNAQAANGRNSVWWLDDSDYYLGQSPLLSPSVFNFFSPNYVRSGALAQAGLVAPEFQITTETQVVGSSNFFHWVVADGRFGFDDTGKLVMDFGPLAEIAGDAARLVDRLNLLFCTGQMSAITRATLIEAVDSIAPSELVQRVKTALFLTLVSPDFVVQK